MLRRKAGRKRFSLLLLEEEEDYVADWVGTCRWPAEVSGAWQGGALLEGRVRLATRSLFFEPDDVRVPIVRLPFSKTQTLEPGLSGGFTLTATAATKMLANMEEVPYTWHKGPPSAWAFKLSYAPLGAILPLAQLMLSYDRLPTPQRTAAFKAFVREREDAVSFDTSRLADFSEMILLHVPATQLTPLVREAGHLVITNRRLYFQPLHNFSGDAPVRSHPLAAVSAVARRRSCLRPVGLEVFFVMHLPPANSAVSLSGDASDVGGLSELHSLCGGKMWDSPSAFFAFRSEQDREAAAGALASCPVLGLAVATPQQEGAAASKEGHGQMVKMHSLLLEAQGGWLHRVTRAWQLGRVSNFSYLLYLNLAAGRSFNDLAQWPVFPWVLSNWVSPTLDLEDPANYRDLSKPVGALNTARLGEFRKRYRDMQTDQLEEGAMPPFMYGTHYSTPGYVMYWLLRAAPAHMLRLQNGRFDAPDRLFHGLQESWESVNSSTTDVKELIPEFFLPGGDWLVNGMRLPLGVRQSGISLGDVELPPWAQGPEQFLEIHRAALESPPVSRNLHHWIDLVFGCKQTGLAAAAADNVFCHLTYEGAVDVSKVEDPMELKALETQIYEFGQTPRQLFGTTPHPTRQVIPPAPDPATVFAGLGQTTSTPQHGQAGVPGPSASPPPTRGGRRGMAGLTGGVGGGSGGPGADVASPQALALALVDTILTIIAVPMAEGSLDVVEKDQPAWRAGGRENITGHEPGGWQIVGSNSSRVYDVSGQEDTGGQTEDWQVSGSLASGATESASWQELGGAGRLDSFQSAGWPGSSKATARPSSDLRQGSGEAGPGQGSDTAVGHGTYGRQGSSGAAAGQGSSDAAAGQSSHGRQGNGTSPEKASNGPHGRSGAAPRPGGDGRQGSGGVLPRVVGGGLAGLLKAGRYQASPQPQIEACPASDPSGTTPGLGERTGHAHPQLLTDQAMPGSAQLPSSGSDVKSKLGSSVGPTSKGPAQDASNLPQKPLQAGSASLHLPLSLAASFLSSLPNATPPAAPAPAPSCLKPAVNSPHRPSTPVPPGWGAGLPERLAALCSVTDPSAASGPGQQRAPSGAGTPAHRHDSHGSGSTGRTVPGLLLAVPAAKDALTGVALWQRPGDPGAHAACVSAGGSLRVLRLPPPPSTATLSSPTGSGTAATVRLQQLEGDLSCLSMLPAGGSEGHPVLVAGCLNQQVYAYSVEQGQLLGSFQAHDDAVCCVLVPPAATGTLRPSRMFTSSWDCSLKVWALGEGRAPWSWSSLAPQPEVVMDLGAGVWALAAGQEGTWLVVCGTEEGEVAACDLRVGRPVWRTTVAQDYIGGVAVSPCGRFVCAGAADGGLSLLDMRRAGTRLAGTRTGAPIRCCATDGTLMVGGSETGEVVLWDVGFVGAASPFPSSRTPPTPDGLYPAWGLPGSLQATSSLTPAMPLLNHFNGGEVRVTGGPGRGVGLASMGVLTTWDGGSGAHVNMGMGREDGVLVVALGV